MWWVEAGQRNAEDKRDDCVPDKGSETLVVYKGEGMRVTFAVYSHKKALGAAGGGGGGNLCCFLFATKSEPFQWVCVAFCRNHSLGLATIPEYFTAFYISNLPQSVPICSSQGQSMNEGCNDVLIRTITTEKVSKGSRSSHIIFYPENQCIWKCRWPAVF